DDIQLLANEFLARFAQQNGKNITRFEDAAWEWIMSYHWPGNVRELKNAVERAVIMARGTTIGPGDVIPRHIRTGGNLPAAVTIPVGATAAEARQQLVLRTFASTSGDTVRTSKVLGLSEQDVRAELRSLIERNGAPAPQPTAKAGTPSKPARPSSPSSRAPAKKSPGKKR
ncbi:MAG TPA: hypothetical protein VF929_07560, partial [Gemmatimonadaceae bacterium]